MTKFYSNHPNHDSGGFTLVELLVVISIIGLLSSTVLAAVNSARAKAKVTASNELAGQYRLAIELAAGDANGIYPRGPTLNFYCLGDYSDNNCGWTNSSGGGGTWSEDVALHNAIKPYMPSLPVIPLVNIGSGFYAESPILACSPAIDCSLGGSSYNGRTLAWYLEGNDRSCAFGKGTNVFGGTVCFYSWP